MSKIVEINGEDLLELDKDEKEFMRMFIQCINIKDYFSKYKLRDFEDIKLYNEFTNTLKETTDNTNKETNPSKALECLDKLAQQIELDEDTDFWEIRNAHKTVEQALIKAQKDEKIILGIEDYLNRRIETEPIDDAKKAFIEIRKQLLILIKEVVK